MIYEERSKEIFKETEVLRTMRDWVRFAVSLFNRERLFFGQGCANAYDEAVYLIQYALRLPLEGPETFFDAVLLPREIKAIKEVLSKRAVERVPAAYITNEAWLGDYKFYVDSRTIVPRSYFKEIIPDQILPWIANPEEITRACDICTGGGSLAILLAMAFPNAKVDALDISENALDVAYKNVRDYGLTDRIRLQESDVFESLRVGNDVYDIIISNPPYEPDYYDSNLPSEFKHEPRLALFGGRDGMEVIRKIVPEAAKKLKKTGLLLIEVGGLQDNMHKEYPGLEINWLPTEDESDCVCLIQAANLKKYFNIPEN